MKFRKRLEFVELPEKSGSDYLNVRSAVRIDVRPGETLNVDTGLNYMIPKNDSANWTIVGSNVVRFGLTPSGYRRLYVKIRNHGHRNIMIYVGEVIASIIGTMKPKPPKRAKAAKKKVATFTSEFELEDAN